MTRAALAFSVISLLPVPLLSMAAFMGGIWPWIALIYLTVFTFAMDEIIAANFDDGREFPAADLLSVTLGAAHFWVLWVVVQAFGRGIGIGEGIALFLATGLFFGQVGNSNAHELIHKPGRGLHNLGKWVYISLLFGHHTSAHRHVHHRYVASDKDPNSARLGESYYRFAARAWIGSFRAGLRAETALRFGRRGLDHPYVTYFLGAISLVAIATWLGGTRGLMVYVGLAFYAQSQLLISDYVQHYGLRRGKLGTGKFEPVTGQHSWNTPHVFSSHLMLNAPRHSDHHAHPMRGYPELKLSQDEPTLPHSLPAMSVLALVPPLWRRFMDPRVAEWQARNSE